MNNPTLVSPGRVALITGGGSGIGFEVARQFGLHGCKGKASGRKLALFFGYKGDTTPEPDRYY